MRKMWRGLLLVAVVGLAATLAAVRADDAPVDDVLATGRCAAEVTDLCSGVTQGEGRLGECLSNEMVSARERGRDVLSPACKRAVTGFMKRAARDPMHLMPSIAASCSGGVQHHCADVPNARILNCLQRVSKRLGSACNKAIFAAMQLEAEDAEISPEFSDACAGDVSSLCADVSREGNGVMKCLQQHRPDVSSACKKQIFAKQQENAQDARLQLTLESACRADISSKCSDISPGDGAVLNCLWEHRNDELHGNCRKQVLQAMVEATSDYRLDPALSTPCESTIESSCAEEQRLVQEMEQPSGGLVIQCLRSQYASIADSPCKRAVAKLVAVQSEDWLADVDMHRRCKADAEVWCATETEETVRACLRKQFGRLSPNCREAEFEEMRLESMDITMKPAMARACRKTIHSDACKDVQPGGARMIECLQNQLGEEGVSEECSAALRADLELSNSDYRLKYGLSMSCKSDIARICYAEAQLESPQGAVLRCLRKRAHTIRDEACKAQVDRFVQMEEKDYRLDPDAKAYCHDDVVSHCSDVQPGHGAVHECLAGHMKQLSAPCQTIEFEMQVKAAESVKFNPVLERQCRAPMRQICNKVNDDEGAMITCLQDHIDDEKMTPNCRNHVRQFSANQQKDWRMNPEVRKSCVDDAQQLCASAIEAAPADSSGAGNRNIWKGEVLSCLKTNQRKVKSNDCKHALRHVVQVQTEDAMANPNVVNACRMDIDHYCSSVSRGQGRIHECLHRHYDSLSEECKKAEFQVQVEEAEDIEANPKVHTYCSLVVDQYCSEVATPDRFDCLLGHTDDTRIPASCHDVLVEERERRHQNLAFNPQLAGACAAPLQSLVARGQCGEMVPDGATASLPDTSASSPAPRLDGYGIHCLIDNRAKIVDKNCAARLVTAIREEVADARANIPLVKACERDIETYCATEARILTLSGLNRCLESHLANLAPRCAKEVQTISDVENESVETNPLLMQHCALEIDRFCHNMPHEDGVVLGCLQLNRRRGAVGFSDACAVEVDRLRPQRGSGSDTATKGGNGADSGGVDSGIFPSFGSSASGGNTTDSGGFSSTAVWLALFGGALLGGVLVVVALVLRRRAMRPGNKHLYSVVAVD